MFDALIKVGGSLYVQAELRANVTAWATLAAERRLLILPGGGPFANGVRLADAQFGLSDSTAHWMAILAMDQYGYLLADLAPGAVLVHDLAAAMQVVTNGRLAILAPFTLLRQIDPLPHTWQVTSDSIAAWLAGYAGIRRLVLLKAVTGVYESRRAGEQGSRGANQEANSATLLRQVSKELLVQSDLVDAYFSSVLPKETECWLIDGHHPERLAEFLRQGSTVGTQVVH
ncbi:MAG TPA: aspartate kinase [Anaerolineae bacterium]|nr:aspartate kinase [Anaerolineae bacterium]